ncbi:hypothetical protein CTAYLR_005422 [Chrysophaeum taylorii]|uniref:PX domain-containing protein n=1 Tax=Chrysophaeum taylorii TaxID=2483200 RepID=A0AAD7XIR2_9STRA|nr:hypothetical protein CTAYLR_005422 [Chrysophaeum taylorii]
MENLVACACSSDVYNEPIEENHEEDAVYEVLPASKCAQILGLHSPDVSYLERRRAYIKSALVMSRSVGPATPWNERAELARRGATSFADIEAAFEGLRSARDAPPGFTADDFLPQLRCSRDGGRTFDHTRPSISAMLHAEVRTPENSSEWEISVKFSTTRFVLTRSLDDFNQLHKKLKQRVPACARALPALPLPEEANGHDKGWFGNSPPPDRKADHRKAVAATRKLRSYLAQAIDWFRARRAYDPDVLEFIDLDCELLLRLHREDMRVVRNIVVSWGGHVAHAIPTKWVQDFVTSITPKRGKSSSTKTSPGPITVRACLDDLASRDKPIEWDMVTKPAWIVLSAVYGADVELDIDTLRKILLQKGLSCTALDAPPTTLLGLPVGAPAAAAKDQQK